MTIGRRLLWSHKSRCAWASKAFARTWSKLPSTWISSIRRAELPSIRAWASSLGTLFVSASDGTPAPISWTTSLPNPSSSPSSTLGQVATPDRLRPLSLIANQSWASRGALATSRVSAPAGYGTSASWWDPDGLWMSRGRHASFRYMSRNRTPLVRPARALGPQQFHREGAGTGMPPSVRNPLIP